MDEVRVEAEVVGPGSLGHLEVILGCGRGQLGGGVSTNVRTDLIPVSLRMPNSRFVAVIRGGELIRVEREGTGRVWLEIQERIRSVLNSDWDPIGVAGAVADEYDGYIGSIYSLLHGGASEAEVAQHLQSIETHRMGLPGTSLEQLRLVAAKLCALDLPSLKSP